MKWLLYLFSLYILVLSGIPCRADDDCCIEETFANAAHPQPEKTGQHPSYPSPCSPFFACGANHGVVIPDLRIQLVQPFHLQAKLPFFYTERSLAAFVSSIWQPPKAA
jgi:hypothetical protein